MSVYIVVLLAQVYNILCMCGFADSRPTIITPRIVSTSTPIHWNRLSTGRKLKKDFSNYLHNILQNLLSIKNMLCKAEQPEGKEVDFSIR